jgi:hypothetical protein
MNNPEDIVQIALSAYDKSWDDKYSWPGVAQHRDEFELELRRLLMQAEPQAQLQQAEPQAQLKPVGPLKRDGEASVTIRASPMHTYTINPPNLMGTWTTTQTDAMGVQSNIINKEILHG